MTVPTYLPYYVLIGTAGIIVAVLFGLNRALTWAHWPADRRFLVPLSIILHIASLAKLRRATHPKVKKQSEIAVAAR